jgi:hypothetical protein
MRDIVELDEGDIIRALAEHVSREKGWEATGHAAVVTLSILHGDDRQEPVMARVERVPKDLAYEGRRRPPPESVW